MTARELLRHEANRLHNESIYVKDDRDAAELISRSKAFMTIVERLDAEEKYCLPGGQTYGMLGIQKQFGLSLVKRIDSEILVEKLK